MFVFLLAFVLGLFVCLFFFFGTDLLPSDNYKSLFSFCQMQFAELLQ